MRTRDTATFFILSSMVLQAGCDGAPGPEPDTFAIFKLLKIKDDEHGDIEGQLTGEDQFRVQDLNVVNKDKKVRIEVTPTSSKEAEYKVKLEDNTKQIEDFNGLAAPTKALDILDDIRDQEPDENGRKCVDKMMLKSETVYEEVMRCDHSYDERCHTTYVTSYVPHQEEDCDEKFRKVCMIWNEQQAVTEMVEECTTPLVPNCLQPGPEVCRTVYDTVCDTKQVGYEVEEQFPNCVTVNMEKCKDVTIGLVTENKCEVWPVQQCQVENRTVTHTQPRTDCRKEPRELCAPGDCPLEEVSTLLSPVCSFNDRLCPGPRCLCSEDEDCRG